MINRQLAEYIRNHYGYDVNTNYYSKITEWESWWRGFYQKFHEYKFNNGTRIMTKKLFTLKMAKKVSEDWASLLLNEKTDIIVNDSYTSKFLQGEKGDGGVLGFNDFRQQGNALIEKVFALGTGAITIRVLDAKATESGNILQNSDAKIKLNYVEANKIIPLSWDNGDIKEVAFASRKMIKGKPFVYLEVHLLDESKQYVIENHYFDVKTGFKEVPLPKGMVPKFYTGSEVPLFAIFKPNIVNPVKGCGAFGFSIYGDALDNLKGVDIAFNNFNGDFNLGGKKVFMNKSLLAMSDEGRRIPPDEINQQLFTYVGDGMQEGQLIQEFNPLLRVEENIKGIQAQLDYLSFKVGFGTKHYQFNLSSSGSGQVTATQYTGDRQDLIQNLSKHYISIKGGLIQLMRGILTISQKTIDSKVKADAEITINFDDSYIVDKDAVLASMQQDVASGLIRPEIYLAKKYGITEKEALKLMPDSDSLITESKVDKANPEVGEKQADKRNEDA